MSLLWPKERGGTFLRNVSIIAQMAVLLVKGTVLMNVTGTCHEFKLS